MIEFILPYEGVFEEDQSELPPIFKLSKNPMRHPVVAFDPYSNMAFIIPPA
jgi:hypothetical protein